MSTHPASAQSAIEGYWEDRFAADRDGGLGIRATVLETNPETGDVYAGGNFARFGDLDLNNVARWTGDGWEPLGQGTNGIVQAMAFGPNGDLVVGGTFTEVYQTDGTPLSAVRVARWDGTQWHALGGGVTSGIVTAVAVMPSGQIVVGGTETVENTDGSTVDVRRIAAWDGTQWISLGDGVNHEVRALAIHPPTGNLIVGGQFTEAQNPDGSIVEARRVARWTGSEWLEMGSGFGGSVDDFAVAPDGTIYASGSGPPGRIAGFDGSEWRTLGGGISGIYARAVAVGNDKVFVGGQLSGGINSDGAMLPSTNVIAWDLRRQEWISMEPGTSNTVHALIYDGTGVLVAGGYNWAGPFPASFLSRWIDAPPPYPAAEVTFRVDTRRLDDFNMLPQSRSVMLNVFNGANAKRFAVLDEDGDGIHSVRVPQPIGTTLSYAYFIDIDRDGFPDNDSWIYERDTLANPRTLTVHSSDPLVLPLVYFDDRPPIDFASDYERSVLYNVRAGNPSTLNFFRGTNQSGGAIDLDEMDRSMRMAAFWYTSDPGGEAPEEIVNIARSTYWRFETVPLAASFSGSLSFDFLPGVAAPEDVRILYRPATDSLWQIVEATVDLDGESLTAEHVTQLSGEWTLGSVSRLNSLTDEPPGLVSDPRPTDGSLNAPLTPTLTWEHAEYAERYDIYVWSSAEPEPNVPTSANLEQPLYHASDLTGAAGTEHINWRVVARNVNGETPGPVWSFEMGSAADLIASNVLAPTSAFSGEEIEVTWVVENAGGGATNVPSWTDHVYLSETAEFEASTAVSLSTVRNLSYLNPGEAYSGSAKVTLPDGIDGTYYVVVFTDRSERGGGALAEPDETNNTAASAPVDVTLTPFADLQVTDIVVAPNVFSGDEINISWTVTNQGTGQTDVPVWFDTVFLSDTDELSYNFAPQAGQTTIRITDPELASIEHSGPLEAGQSYTVNHPIRLPEDAIGEYHVFVYTDIRGGLKQPERGDVYEFNQELNNWTSDPVSITLTPPPDLVVTSVEAPSSATSGEKVDLAWTVLNQGPGATRTDTWYDIVYFSSSPALDPATAHRLGRFEHTGIVQNDSSYIQTRTVQIPEGVDGDGYFFVHANSTGQLFEYTFTDNNVGVNDAASAIIRASYPDLVVSNISVRPVTATAGQQVAISYEQENAGSAQAVGWNDELYVSTSPLWDPEVAISVASTEVQSSLADGDARTKTQVVTLPPELEGPYYVFVWSDANDRVFEYPNEAGNVFRSSAFTALPYPRVDLQAELVSVPESAVAGSSIELEFRVRNAGEGRTTSNGWTDEIYLSPEPGLNLDTAILLQRMDHEGALEGGAEYLSVVTASLPEGTTGEFFILLKTDVTGSVADDEASNNEAASAISLAPPPPVDLEVTQIEAPAGIGSGEVATIQWTVTNAGQAAAGGGEWFDAVYISEDARRDRGDQLLGSRPHTAGLAAGASYTADLEVSLPAFRAGRYYLLVHTDQREDIYEHEREFNNTADVRVDLSLPAPSDLQVSNVTAPAQAAPGDVISVGWTLVNAGANPARGRMREAVFVSKDEVWDPEDMLLGVADIDVDLAPGEEQNVMMKVDLGRTFRADRVGNITGEMPAVSPGDYFMLVRTDVANTIRETDDTNNAAGSPSPVRTDVDILELGAPTTAAFRPGQRRLFRIDVEEGRDLRLTLTSNIPAAGNELYVAHGRVPSTDSGVDFSSAEPFTANHELMVPSTASGAYFVLVVSRTLPEAEQDIELFAEALDFSISSITPNSGGQGQVTTRIQGAGFRESDRIVLRDASGAESEPEHVAYEGSIELTARWNLTDVPLGDYDVIVRRSDAEIATLEEGFKVEPATRLVVEAEVVAPEAIRKGGSARYSLHFRNTGNVDVPYLIIELGSSFAKNIEVETTEQLLTLTDILPADFNPSGRDFVYSDSRTGSVPLFYRDFPAGASASAIVTFEDPADPLLLSLTAEPLNRSQHVDRLEEQFEIIRDVVQRDPQSVDPFFADLAARPEEFVRRYFNVYVALGLLDPRDVEAMGKSASSSAGATAASQSDESCLIFYQDGSVAEHWPCPPDPPPPPPPGPPPPGPNPPPGPDPPPPPLGACGSYDLCLQQKATQCGYTGVFHCAALGGLAGILTVGVGGIIVGAACSALYVKACDTSNPNSLPQTICTPIKQSCDPNDIIGPAGFSRERWVRRDATLPYRIRFENDPERASAPAQVVSVDHPLDPTVDARRFRLGPFGFGRFTFEPPENVSYYQTRLDVADSLGVAVDVTAGIDVIGNKAFWVFRSVDPQTGDQPTNDPFAGFLPVNDETQIGEGFATYAIRPSDNAATGDVIDAQASIVFDINAPLDTPPVFNTVDATPPVSSVGVQPARVDTALLYISWSGTDEGSGIRDYQLYASKHGGPFEPYQTATADTSLLFQGELDNTYRFFTIATDNVGNVEPMKSEGEAVVVVTVEDEEPGVPGSFALHPNYPNPFNPRTTIPFDIAEPGDVQIAVYNILGQRVFIERRDDMKPGHYQHSLDMSSYASGVYFYELRVLDKSRIRFRDVRKFVLVK